MRRVMTVLSLLVLVMPIFTDGARGVDEVQMPPASRHGGSDEATVDPGPRAILARATELEALVFQHTWLKITGNLPDESTPMELAELAARHPKATLLCAHSGGDWEVGLRAIRPHAEVDDRKSSRIRPRKSAGVTASCCAGRAGWRRRPSRGRPGPGSAGREGACSAAA